MGGKGLIYSLALLFPFWLLFRENILGNAEVKHEGVINPEKSWKKLNKLCTKTTLIKFSRNLNPLESFFWVESFCSRAKS
jgi:hypothetical protein